jgi:hypothetical protein
MRQMSREQLETAMGHVHSVQLTYGCSVGCWFCGCDVPKGVRATLPDEIVDFLANNFQPQFELRQPYLYGNNDPLDWTSRGKDFRYAYDRLTNQQNWGSSVSTAVPPGKEELALACVQEGYLARISISSMNERRLTTRAPDIYAQAEAHDVELFYPERKLLAIGRASDQALEADSLSNRVGTLVTPLGIYTINLTCPSIRYPTSEIDRRIDPEKYRVIEWGRRKNLPTEIWDYWIYSLNGPMPVQTIVDPSSQIVDAEVTNVHLFLKMFYAMRAPANKKMEKEYLSAASRAILDNIPGGDFSTLKPSNEESERRADICSDMVPRMVRTLKKRGDRWSKRKVTLLEDHLADN